MPVQVSYPGVYVQEVPSGVRTITGVSTSIAAFVGMVRRGRLKTPSRVLSFTEYERRFGSDTADSEMTDQVRQFFFNGGREAWITRIATGAKSASVQLKSEAGSTVLQVEALEEGPDGSLIRIEIDYSTPHPEQTFNLRAFRVVTNAFGVPQIQADETFVNLSMNSASGRYVETVVNQQSELIKVTVAGGLTPSEGFSLAGVLFEPDNAAAVATINSLLSATANSIQISVDGAALVPVALPQPVTTPPLPNPLQELEDVINLALTPLARKVTVRLIPGPTDSRYLEIRSVKTDGSPNPGGSVEVRPGFFNDGAAALQLGSAQGGVEVGGHAALRPAPTNFFARMGPGVVAALTDFSGTDDLGTWTLTDASGSGPHTATPTFASPGDRMYIGTLYTGPGVGSLRNVRQNLQILADAINANSKSSGGQDLWQASLQSYRLVLRALFGGVNGDTTASLISNGAYNLGGAGQFFDGTSNVTSYSLGTTGIGNFQSSGIDGAPGSIPGPAEYRDAFDTMDRNVDLFNLLILPRANGQSDDKRGALWGIASDFCLRRRAFLLVDPRITWKTANQVNSEIEQMRIGIVKDHAAIYWPRVIVNENGIRKGIDPSGSIAGLMARIDANRGVWKAPAGVEADIRAVRGVEYTMSDPENGLINPEAVNAIRLFPTGVVSWGARTMDGTNDSTNSDYKYVPVRRLALFLEESLYRGLKFAVFEPNDEPLWAQIRLAAGAFMNNLFRQGAFQGQKASDAYFVKCDSETTTQNDINLGIVNVVVGFAPLKPAEFVIITIKQKAGQVQV